MALEAPTQSEIRTAKTQAVGGGRKRCRKGKNCSAACIQAGMECLVEMPESAGIAASKVSAMLTQRMSGKLPAPAAPTVEKLKPMAAVPAGRTEAQKIGAQEKQARIKEQEDKARKKTTDSMAAKAGYGKGGGSSGRGAPVEKSQMS